MYTVSDWEHDEQRYHAYWGSVHTWPDASVVAQQLQAHPLFDPETDRVSACARIVLGDNDEMREYLWVDNTQFQYWRTTGDQVTKSAS